MNISKNTFYKIYNDELNKFCNKHITQKESSDFLNVFFNTINLCLENNHRIVFTNFGAFQKKKQIRKEKEYSFLNFKPSRTLSEKTNQYSEKEKIYLVKEKGEILEQRSFKTKQQLLKYIEAVIPAYRKKIEMIIENDDHVGNHFKFNSLEIEITEK